MKARTVRISSITIKNFKNVIFGSLSLENKRKPYKASIVGLYGQNGSGKTALIEAIELLKYALCGRQIPEKFVDFINLDSDVATLSFDFQIEINNSFQTISYQFDIKSFLDDIEQNTDVPQERVPRIRIVHELIKCPILTDKQIKMGRLIETDDNDVFSPKSKRLLLTGIDKETLTDIFVIKKLTAASSRSFIFSKELLTLIRDNVKKETEMNKLSKELDYYFSVIESLVEFGNRNLFIINTAHSGLISLNAQPLIFKYEGENIKSLGTIMLPLNAPAVVDEHQKRLVERIIKSMNIVLEQIIPGLTINVKNLGTQVMDNGEVGNRLQLISNRRGKEFALKNESEGIKKIISILQLLIVVYNQPSITVAIDELDSGVFEYLLGEVLRIISEKGKGQLIFTSHNLRPLETLDFGFIAFTTTNPENRYMRMKNVKNSNNLRDFYYRDIMLGEQNEELYEPTHNSGIALAFREAGEYDDS